MRSIDRIVIHCTATPNGRMTTVADVDLWHKQRGWTGIGYHYLITLDGVAHKGRDERDIGAHVAGHNAHSIGIALVGTDKFTAAQWVALALLLREIETRYPKSAVVGHGDLIGGKKLCPGFSVPEWVACDYAALVDHLL